MFTCGLLTTALVGIMIAAILEIKNVRDRKAELLGMIPSICKGTARVCIYCLPTKFSSLLLPNDRMLYSFCAYLKCSIHSQCFSACLVKESLPESA